jgi:hypothetical protein
VDFVIEREGNIIPIETKLNIKEPKITPGLKNFIEKYHPPKAYVINLSLSKSSVSYDKTKIHYIYPYELRTML